MLGHGPSSPALRALDPVHDRIESPADGLLRHAGAQLAGAGALGRIGFTMSLFIAGEAFRSEADFEAAKIAVS